MFIVFQFVCMCVFFLLILQLQINFTKYNIIARSRIRRVRFVCTRGAGLTKQLVIFHSFFQVAVVFHLACTFSSFAVSFAIFVIRTRMAIKKKTECKNALKSQKQSQSIDRFASS